MPVRKNLRPFWATSLKEHEYGITPSVDELDELHLKDGEKIVATVDVTRKQTLWRWQYLAMCFSTLGIFYFFYKYKGHKYMDKNRLTLMLTNQDRVISVEEVEGGPGEQALGFPSPRNKHLVVKHNNAEELCAMATQTLTGIIEDKRPWWACILNCLIEPPDLIDYSYVWLYFKQAPSKADDTLPIFNDASYKQVVDFNRAAEVEAEEQRLPCTELQEKLKRGAKKGKKKEAADTTKTLKAVAKKGLLKMAAPCMKLAENLVGSILFPYQIVKAIYTFFHEIYKAIIELNKWVKGNGGMKTEFMANRDQKCVIFRALGSQQTEVDAFLKAVLEARARKTGDTGFPAGLVASGEFTTTSGAGLLQGGSPRKPSINAEKLALLDGETVQDVLCMDRRDTCGDWIKAIFTFGIFYFLVMKPRRALKQSIVRTNRRLIDVCCRGAGASSCCSKLPPQEICVHYLDMVPLAMVSTGTNIKPDGTPGPPQVMKCGCCPVARHIKFNTGIIFRSGVLTTEMDSQVQSLAIVQQAQRFYAPFLKLSMGKPFSFDGPASSAPSGSDVISSAALAATDNIAAFVHYDCPPIEAADRQALKAAQGNGCGCCKAPLPSKVFKELAITQDKIVLSEHGWNWGKEETFYQIQTQALDRVASTAMQQTYPMMVLASKCCGCCGVVPATLFHNHVHGFPGTKLQLTGTVDDFVTDWVNTVDDPSLETAVCRISEFVSARANDRVNAKVMNRV